MKIVISSKVAAQRLGVSVKMLSSLRSCAKHRITASNNDLEDQDFYYYAQGIDRLLEDEKYRDELNMTIPGWYLTNPFSIEPIWIEVKEHPSFELDDVD